MKHLVLQLYSLRELPDAHRIVDLVASVGLTRVEGFGDPNIWVRERHTVFQDAGIEMPSFHVPIDIVRRDWATAAQTLKRLGVRQAVIPYLVPDQRPQDRAGWEAMAEELADFVEKFARADLSLAWHNHDFEIAPLPDGTVALEILGRIPGLKIELDLAWVVRAGGDPVDWVERLQDRLDAVHLKDVTAAEDADPFEQGWADLGHGSLPWDLLRPLIEAVPLKVLEHDRPRDPARFLRRSVDTAHSWGWT